MTLDSNINEKDRSWLPVLTTLGVSVLLLVISSVGWLNGLKSFFSYILDPIYATSANVAGNIQEYFSTLTNISEFRNEYNQMKIEIAQYEVDIADYQNLKNENDDLRSQLQLQNKEYKYVQSKVLDRIDSDFLIINTGQSDGVQKGDVVVFGNTLIGILIEVNQYTSKVRLPISKSSFFETYIVASDDITQRKVLSRAVSNGSSDGIRIENIGMNSGVKNGDIVIVNDSKVGDHLILGNIVGLSEDPATTTRTGYVSAILDYYDLINVFVRIEDGS